MIKEKNLSPDISLLSIDESTAAKGFLIVLIVLGHNIFFTNVTDAYRVQDFLYCFHIQTFFILPFLYGSRKLSKERIKDYFIRLYWPYIVFSLILYIGYYIFWERHNFEFLTILKVWFWGDSTLLKEYTGVQILWFLPAFFSLTIIKDYYYYASNKIKILLLILSIVCIIKTLLSRDWSTFHNFFQNILPIGSPFGIINAMTFLAYGVVLRFLLCKFIFRSLLLFSIWILLTILFFVNSFLLNYNIWLLTFIGALFPVVFVALLYNLRFRISNYNIFHKLGKVSFPVYIAHPFIGYLLVFLLVDYEFYHPFIKIITILVSLFLMLWGAYIFAIGINKSPLLQRLLFPRSIKHFLNKKKK